MLANGDRTETPLDPAFACSSLRPSSPLREYLLQPRKISRITPIDTCDRFPRAINSLSSDQVFLQGFNITTSLRRVVLSKNTLSQQRVYPSHPM